MQEMTQIPYDQWLQLCQQWIQIASIFIANAALILWFRAESRADWRHMDNKLDSLQKSTDAKIDAIHNTMKAIHEDMKDFHGKLERQDAEFKAHMVHLHKEQ